MLHRIPFFAPTKHAHGLVALAMLELILDLSLLSSVPLVRSYLCRGMESVSTVYSGKGPVSLLDCERRFQGDHETPIRSREPTQNCSWYPSVFSSVHKVTRGTRHESQTLFEHRKLQTSEKNEKA